MSAVRRPGRDGQLTGSPTPRFPSSIARANVCPSIPAPAFRVGEKTADPLTMYLSDVFTVPASLAGLPAISVPSGLTRGGLPLGIQVLGPAFGEDAVFAAARALEMGADFPDALLNRGLGTVSRRPGWPLRRPPWPPARGKAVGISLRIRVPISDGTRSRCPRARCGEGVQDAFVSV